MKNLVLYLSAFWPHWWPLVSAGGLLGTDVFVRAHWQWGKRQLDRIPEPARRKIEITTFILALFYAGFATWLEEHEASVRAEVAPVPYRWVLLTSEEAAALRAELREIPMRHTDVLCNDGNCDDLARSLVEVFHDVGWGDGIVRRALGWNDDGLIIRPNDAIARSVADGIEKATHGRLKVQLRDKLSNDDGTTVAIGNKL